MQDNPLQDGSPAVLRVAGVMAAAVLGMVVVGYGVHEHHAAQAAMAQNVQANAELSAAHNQLNALTAKVDALAAQQQQQQAQAVPPPAPAPIVHRLTKPRAGHAADRRLTKMQEQLDAQGKEIEQTRGDLQTATTQLTGSIAHTHDELVVLEKRGESSYFEFDIYKSKDFRHEGPVGVSLRKANVKHQYADLQLMVDDRNLVQKHVNLDQPVMFYMPDTEQPIQIVINDITKDHIHGYVSAPKYRKSELAAMNDANANATPAQDASTSADTQSEPRRKLTVPQ